jgi:hypothetical protein
VVDEQLGASVQQLAERLLAVVRVEAILLLHPHPRQLAPLPREFVVESGVLLLAGKELLTRGEPFLAGSNLVISHLGSPLCLSQQLRAVLALS